MKKLGYVLSLITLASLAACTTPAEQVMSPITYNQPVNVHVAKNAALYWQTGRQQASIEPIHVSNNNIGGALPISVASQTMQAAVETGVRKEKPGRLTYVYGKQQQAIFMTSLKDVLQQNQVFNQTQLVANANQVPAQDVSIKIDFKSTRVLDAQYNHRIVLDVDMTIKSHNKPAFTRTYVVQSSDEITNFKAQQTDVSQRLLDKVMKGIKQWAAENK